MPRNKKRSALKTGEIKLKRIRNRSSRLSKHYKFMQRLFSTRSKKTRRQLVTSATKSEILALTEFIYNILIRAIPLTSRQKKSLCKFQRELHLIVDKKTPCEVKRKLIKKSEQKG